MLKATASGWGEKVKGSKYFFVGTSLRILKLEDKVIKLQSIETAGL